LIAQDDKFSTTSTNSVSSDIAALKLIKFPGMPSHISGKQEPITLSTPDGAKQFIIIPQNSEGISYYILIPVQQQNQTFTCATSTCASTAQDIQAGTKFEPLPVELGKLHLEEDFQKSETDVMRRTDTSNKEKDKSNLSVLSLVCSDLLNQNTVYGQTNKEISGNRFQIEDSKSLQAITSNQNNNTINTPVNWNPVDNESQKVNETNSTGRPEMFENPVFGPVRRENPQKTWILESTSAAPYDNRVMADNTAYVTSQVDNEDHPPSFETPSVGSPLLFPIPANSYSVSPAQYMPIKHKYSIDGIKHSKREFQLSQNQIPMHQSYYGISPFISQAHPSSAYMAQNQAPSFYQLRYNSQRFPQHTPTSLSFAFNPGVPSTNTSQSQIHNYINASASPNGSDVSQ